MVSRSTPIAGLCKTLTLTAAALIASVVGCNLFPSGLPDGKTIEPGDSFGTAKLLALASDGSFSFSGTVVGGVVDYYDLGPVSPGDRVIVTVEPAAGSTLDPTTAIFDENEELFANNDDVDLEAGLYGSAIDDYVAKAGDHLFLAIAKFFNDAEGGAYDVTVRIERGGPAPTPPVQVLLLNFAGGSVAITGEGALDLDPFDAADVDAAYAGDTAAIKARIVEVVRENFEDTGVQIVTSDDPAPAAGTFSAIHFGAFSPTKFGVADGVDHGNKDCCDDGIVFTNGFDGPFGTQPSTDGIATAIGNVAAHEAGHLLGLNHVADVTALMDNTGTASTLLADQDFKTAPLSPSVFPVGHQNAPAMLDRVVPK